MLVREPIRICSVSPRSTAPYQTLYSSPRCTSPTTYPPGATTQKRRSPGPRRRGAAAWRSCLSDPTPHPRLVVEVLAAELAFQVTLLAFDHPAPHDGEDAR